MLDFGDIIAFKTEEKKEPSSLVVRVSTEYYSSRNSQAIIFKKKVKPLKNKSTPNMLDLWEEEILNCGADMFMKSIINLNDVDDGIYEMKMVNITHDFESGYVDGWDWKLFKISLDI